MPSLEIIDESIEPAAGIFRTRADQTRFRSTFGVIEGTPRDGFQPENVLNQRQVYSHIGKAGSAWERYRKPGKEGGENIVEYAGMKLVEMIIPKEEMDEKQADEARLSRDRIDGTRSVARVGLEKTGMKPEESDYNTRVVDNPDAD